MRRQIRTKCLEAGKSHNTALILQAIPALGPIGVSYGYLYRWDLFFIIWGTFLSMMVCTCILSLSESCKESGLPTIGSCFSGLWSMLVLTMYIYGLVVIINNEMVDGNGCKLV